jgi:hypothetical protein
VSFRRLLFLSRVKEVREKKKKAEDERSFATRVATRGEDRGVRKGSGGRGGEGTRGGRISTRGGRIRQQRSRCNGVQKDGLRLGGKEAKQTVYFNYQKKAWRKASLFV